MNSKKSIVRNDYLDLIKGIGCIGVVFIHILFPQPIGSIIMKLSEFAVPIFFLISGYYSYNSNEVTLLRRSKKILLILFASVIFYTFYKSSLVLMGGHVEEWLKQLCNWRLLIKIILIGDFDIIGAGHLYFLHAQIIAYLFLIWINKVHGYKYIYKLLPIIFIIRIFIYGYTLTYGLSWHIRGNFIVDAIPWMLLGNYVACNEKKLVKKYSIKVLMILCVFGLLFAELFVVKSFVFDFSEIGIVMYSLALFLFSLHKKEIKLNNNYFVKIGCYYSLYIYVLHIAIGGIVSIIMKRVSLGNNGLYLWMKPFIVVLLSIIVSIIIVKILKTIKRRNE